MSTPKHKNDNRNIIIFLYIKMFGVIKMDYNLITYLACICFIFIFGRIFIVPIKKILKLVLNSIIGGIVIFLINMIGGILGFHIGLNFFTSIIIRNTWNSRSNISYYFEIHSINVNTKEQKIHPKCCKNIIFGMYFVLNYFILQ